MIWLFVSLLISTVSMVMLEKLSLPRRKNAKLFHRVTLLEIMPSIVFFTTIFMISYRPWFSGIATVIVFSAIVVVNNAKYAALKEPLVFSDFSLLRQAIKHPRLYVKYIGVVNIISVFTLGALAIVGGAILEPPLIQRTGVNDYLPVIVYLLTIIGLIFSVTRGPFRRAFGNVLRSFGPTADVTKDMGQLSLVVCLIFYFFLAKDGAGSNDVQRSSLLDGGRLTPRSKHDLPDVVVVQSESFFDARRLHPTINSDLLRNYDKCKLESSYYGRLEVPAWGANTMRTEFAVLSGLPNGALGYHRFNPYISMCKKPVWTIAHQLRDMGYRTVCVHPFHSSFFDRKTVFPNLGFDVFLDIESFEGAESFGPYISDQAVAQKIADELGDYDGPQFIFAITMENHGMWEKGRLDGFPKVDTVEERPLESEALGMYLQHLANTDILVEKLSDVMREREGDGILCLYGDHLPSFPDTFNKVGHDDPRTDYFVWEKNGHEIRELDTTADVLGRLIMDAVFNSTNEMPSTVSAQAAER